MVNKDVYWQFSVSLNQLGKWLGEGVWLGEGDGDTWPGVNDLPSAWRNGRASNYSDWAALLLMSL